MPKRKKVDSDDDEYVGDDSPDDEHSADDDFVEDDDDDYEPEVPVKPKKKKAPSRAKKPTAAEREAWRDLVSTAPRGGGNSDRLTANGGYSHTLDSKMKISRANKGNTPWNKGKQRSAADRAKIGAGVRARNRAILLEKLAKIGMSEDEWFEKKKQLKYLRERVRKAKAKKDDKLLAEHQQKLESALDEQNKVNSQSSQLEQETALKNKGPTKGKKGEVQVQEKAGPPALQGEKKQSPTSSDARKKPASKTKGVEEAKPLPKLKPADPPKTKRNDIPHKTKTVEKSYVNYNSLLQNDKEPKKRHRSSSTTPNSSRTPGGIRLADIFAKDVKFQKHEFESSTLENPYEVCVNGGPGGLICCANCTKAYSGFLTSTAKDIEQQKTRKVNKEVIELLGFLDDAKSKLHDKLLSAKQRTKAGPLHRPQKRKRTSQHSQAQPPPRKQAATTRRKGREVPPSDVGMPHLQSPRNEKETTKHVPPSSTARQEDLGATSLFHNLLDGESTILKSKEKASNSAAAVSAAQLADLGESQDSSIFPPSSVFHSMGASATTMAEQPVCADFTYNMFQIPDTTRDEQEGTQNPEHDPTAVEMVAV